MKDESSYRGVGGGNEGSCTSLEVEMEDPSPQGTYLLVSQVMVQAWVAAACLQVRCSVCCVGPFGCFSPPKEAAGIMWLVSFRALPSACREGAGRVVSIPLGWPAFRQSHVRQQSSWGRAAQP